MPVPTEPPPSPNVWAAAIAAAGTLLLGLVAMLASMYRSLRSNRGKGGPLRETDTAAAETERTEITAKLEAQKAEIAAEQHERDRTAQRMADLEKRIDANHADSLARVKAHADREAEWMRERAAMEKEWVRQIDTLTDKVTDFERQLAALRRELESERVRSRALLAENERLRREGETTRRVPPLKKVDPR